MKVTENLQWGEIHNSVRVECEPQAAMIQGCICQPKQSSRRSSWEIMIVELSGAIMWSQRKKPTLWKRAKSWIETKCWWYHWISESNHVWSQDYFWPSQLSESIFFFLLLLQVIWTGISIHFYSLGYWVYLNNWT